MTSYRDKFKSSEQKPQKLSEIINKNLSSGGAVAKKSISDIAADAESERHIKALLKFKKKNFVNFNYNEPETFSFYGSAQKYYKDRFVILLLQLVSFCMKLFYLYFGN